VARELDQDRDGSGMVQEWCEAADNGRGYPEMNNLFRHRLSLAAAASLLGSLMGHTTPAVAGTCSVQATSTASGTAVQIHATASCSGGVQAIRFIVDGIPITEVKGPDATVTWRSDDPAGSHTIAVAAAEVGDTTWGHAARAPVNLSPTQSSPSSTWNDSGAPRPPVNNNNNSNNTASQACHFEVRPGAWTRTGVSAKKGESFSITARGSLTRSTDTWGPGGYYLLGFFAFGLNAKIDGGSVRGIGTSGNLYADKDGEVLLGTALTYEPKPTDAKDIQGSFSVTLDPCGTRPGPEPASASATADPVPSLTDPVPSLTEVTYVPDGAALFQQMMPVFNSPRCASCHGRLDVFAADTPHKGGTQDRVDSPWAQCQTCHTRLATDDGPAIWRQPDSDDPARWGNLSASEICHRLLSDRAGLIEHLENDPRVALGFEGLRGIGDESPYWPIEAAPPPIDRDTFIELARQWLDAASQSKACPD
jgi:Bacterial Ig domain